MSFLNPIWLWGLGALAIPIGIHLLSRKEGKTIRIGSIRFLTETSTSKFSSIKLNEVALLVVRSLLILLIVLFLAGLLLQVTNNKISRKWVLVESGLENEEHVKTILDSLQKNEFEIRKLEKGFPLIETDTIQNVPDYYQLAEYLSHENNLQVTVVATNSITGFKGKRIALPKDITWLHYPTSAETNQATNRVSKSDTLTISLVYEKDFQDDKKIIKAALQAIQQVAPKEIIITETPIQNYKSTSEERVIWLANDKFSGNRKSLTFNETNFNNLIIQKTKNQWYLTKRLTQENAIENHLPVELMAMLFEKEKNQHVTLSDRRTISNELAWAEGEEVQAGFTETVSQPFHKVIFLLVVLLFITERILAFYRKQ